MLVPHRNASAMGIGVAKRELEAMTIRTMLWLGALLALPGAALAGDPFAQERDGVGFARFVERTLADHAVPGAVVAIVGPDGVSVKGFGLREAGRPGRVDPDTRFQIASMSKLVAAVAVGTLADRGLVDFDRPVIAFSPQTQLAVPYASQNASLRDYFSHRTGLPAYAGDLLTQYGLPSDALAARARYLPLDGSFRERMQYSNYGIFLGQHAAASVAGMSPPQLLSQAVLEPLGMARSGPVRATLFGDENRAAAHDRDGAVMENEDVDAFSGAGAVVSTGNDIARFMRMLLAGGAFEGRQILAQETLERIFAASMVEGPFGPLHDPNGAAGLGCDSYRFLAERVVEKNGALNGVRTILTMVPGKRTGIAIFANKQVTVLPEAIRAEFLERVVGPSGRDLQAEIRAEQPLWNSLVALPKAPADAAPMAHAPGDYAGDYESPLYGQLVLTPAGEGFTATLGGQEVRLAHWSGDTFLMSLPNPDIAPGLLTFGFTEGEARATAIEGSPVPRTLTISYGRFDRVR